jgi:hypothetical protein
MNIFKVRLRSDIAGILIILKTIAVTPPPAMLVMARLACVARKGQITRGWRSSSQGLLPLHCSASLTCVARDAARGSNLTWLHVTRGLCLVLLRVTTTIVVVAEAATNVGSVLCWL